MVRAGRESRARPRRDCDVINGALGDVEAVDNAVSGADASTYNVGILRKFPDRGISFDGLHDAAALRLSKPPGAPA
jgi:NADH dehydrogenase